MKIYLWYVLGFLAILVVVLVLILTLGKRPKKLKPVIIDLPDSGAGIPQGWRPEGPAQNLLIAVEGVGTDENLFFSTLRPLTNDQRAAVVNSFNRNQAVSTGYTLAEWVQGDFSGSDLSEALDLISNFNQG
jgi:hypothetical protein